MSRNGQHADTTRTRDGRMKPLEFRATDTTDSKTTSLLRGRGEKKIEEEDAKGAVRAVRVSVSAHKASDDKALDRGHTNDRSVRGGRNVSARIVDLARQVERLTVTRRDPHRFFEDRSETAEELRSLARTLPPAKTRAES